MLQKILKTFISQPEIVGVAICQDTLIPYFYIDEQVIPISQKLKLANELRKALSKLPTTLNSLEFKIADFFAYAIYINAKLRLVVLLTNNSDKIRQLINLQITSVSHLSAIKSIQVSDLLNLNLQASNETPIKTSIVSTEIKPEQNSIADTNVSISIQDFLVVINRLSLLVSNFLGPQITATHWQLTRPEYQYLSKFEIDKKAQIRFTGDTDQSLSSIMHLGFKLWLDAFFKKASQLIHNLPDLIAIECQEEHREEILSIIPASYLCKTIASLDDDTSLFADTDW